MRFSGEIRAAGVGTQLQGGASRLCKHAEITVPSLDDWEREWKKNLRRNIQTRLVAVDFHPSLSVITQSN
jgi:hypothetical protein